MDRSSIFQSVALAVAALLISTALAWSQTNIEFDPTGPATWNDDNNWDPAFTPEAQYNENAVIGLGKTAFVDDTPPAVGGITINSGTLEIRANGNLTAEPEAIVTGHLAINDTGTLNVLRGGTLSVRNMTAESASTIVLGQTTGLLPASIQTTGATLSGQTRIIGPNSNFASSGNIAFTSSSVLHSVITGSNHSAITTSATAQLSGVLRPEFSGHVPQIGDSWAIVDAGNVTGKFTLDLSEVPVAPFGAGYSLSQSGGNVLLHYTNSLVLTVDRASGTTSLRNVIGTPISFDAYTVTSQGGHLGGEWNSLDKQEIGSWDEADINTDFRLTEFRPSGVSTLSAGASLPIGAPYAPPTPTAFGQQVGEDLAFQYAVPGIGTLDGIVEYVGAHNNLVLTIDPVTGHASIQNESPYFDVAIDGYTIQSTSGRLRPAQWTSLDDQNLGDWDKADNVNTFRVTEFNPSGQTSMPGGGTLLQLGQLVDVTGDLRVEDFTFEFATVGGNAPDGDFNGDGAVDAADYVVWRRTSGSPAAYQEWRNNFGNTGGSGPGGYYQGIVVFGSLSGAGSGGATAVPEPNSFFLGLGALLVSIAAACRPCRQD